MAVKRFYFFGSYSVRPLIMEVMSNSSAATFQIRSYGSSGTNYDVKTSDGQMFFNQTGSLTITFPSPSTLYTIEISGKLDFNYQNNSSRVLIRDIKQWGDLERTIYNQSFRDCINMECSAQDSPDFENINNVTNAFQGCTKFNPTTFNVLLANLTNGHRMFNSCKDFNPSDFAPTLASLTSGGNMFNGATSFNPPLFNPTLASLTNGTSMFKDAASFNPPLFNPTLENLINGFEMFFRAINFAQDINAPNSIHLLDDRSMFTDTKIAKITMNNTALTTTDTIAFRCPQLTDLILIDRKIDLWINQTPLLLSTKIDALANSVADLTSLTSATVTMTQTQYNSCDTTIWTNKNWVIAIA